MLKPGDELNELEKESVDQDRRAFLNTYAKAGLVAAPVITTLLATSLTSPAIARSTGGGGNGASLGLLLVPAGAGAGAAAAAPGSPPVVAPPPTETPAAPPPPLPQPLPPAPPPLITPERG